MTSQFSLEQFRTKPTVALTLEFIPIYFIPFKQEKQKNAWRSQLRFKNEPSCDHNHIKYRQSAVFPLRESSDFKPNIKRRLNETLK